MKLDLKLRSLWERIELWQEAVYQAFEQPRTHGMMPSMFSEFVTRMKMHLRDVEPTCIDFAIRVRSSEFTESFAAKHHAWPSIASGPLDIA